MSARTWDLSGGTTYGQDAGQDASTSFGPGQHTVAILITDCDGGTTRIEKTFTITNQPPTGTISIVDPGTDPPANHTMTTFHADVSDPDQGTDGTCAAPTYSWDLSGNTTYGQDAGQDASTSFGPGQHTVAILITDCDGGTTRIEKTFTITNQAPTGSISMSPDPAQNHTTETFTADNVSDPDQGTDGTCANPTYAWDLSGGTDYTHFPGTQATASFGPGQHTVALQITDCDGGTTVVTKTFSIPSQAPTGSISILSPGTDPPANHTTTTFHASDVSDPDQGTDGTCAAPTYSWDLGGGTTYGQDAGQDASTSFGPGQHTVALLITDCDGETTRVEKTFTITNQPPTGSITPSTTSPKAGAPVTFTATNVTDPDQGTDGTCAAPTYGWDLTGGTNYTQFPNANATGTFGVGTHTVALGITDCDGTTAKIPYQFTIPPTATVKIAPKQTLAGALSKGIKATLTGNEAFTSKLTLTVTKATSKAGKPMTITGSVATAKPALTKAGSVHFTIQFTSTGKSKLSEAKSVTFALKGAAKDKSGHIVPIRVSFTLH